MDPLFQVLVQNSSDAVAMLDADGTIRFLSDSAARLLGYSLGERITRSALELMHPDDAPRARDSFVECLRRPGVPLAAEYRLRHKDGSWRNLEGIAVNRLDHPAIAAVVVNYRDVTDRRLAEEALRVSEEHLRPIAPSFRARPTASTAPPWTARSSTRTRRSRTCSATRSTSCWRSTCPRCTSRRPSAARSSTGIAARTIRPSPPTSPGSGRTARPSWSASRRASSISTTG